MLEKPLPKNRFARSVSVLAGGAAGAQLIVIAASPLLTRLYTPEDFGLLAVFAGILGILGVIASLRYQLAIPLPESDAEAANIVALSLAVVSVTTLITAVVVWIFGDQFVHFFNMPKLAPFLWLIPAGLFLVGVYQVLEYWAVRKKVFYNIARTRFIQSLGMVITQVVGYTLGPVALLLGRVVGQSAGILGLGKLAFKKNREDFKVVSSQEMRAVAIKYKKFPIVATWTGLASSAGMNLPPLLIASFLGASSAGLFSLAYRVLSQPMTVIGKAVSDAFYQKAAEANRSGELGKEVEGVYSILVKLALAPAVTMFIVMPDLFVIIFGNSWSTAGEIARWMTPWLFFQFVVSPCTGIYPIINRHDIALRFQLSLLASSVVGVVIGGAYFDSLVFTVALISVLSGMVYLWRVATTFKVVGLSGLKPTIYLVRAVPLSVLVNLPLILTYLTVANSVLAIIVGVLGNVLLWAVFLVRPVLRLSGVYNHEG